MPLMIKLNRNVVRVNLCLDNVHFITVYKYNNIKTFFEYVKMIAYLSI